MTTFVQTNCKTMEPLKGVFRTTFCLCVRERDVASHMTSLVRFMFFNSARADGMLL